MVKKDTEKKKNVKTLKEELEQKGKEIEQLQNSVAEMREQIQEKQKTKEADEPDKTVSGLLTASLGTLDASDIVKGKKPNGLLGLVNELGKLAQKAQVDQTTRRTTIFGKRSIVDFRISSRPIRGALATQPASVLKIIKPSKQSSKGNIILPPSAGTIEEKEPIVVDVFEEEDYLCVMAQLPTVRENEIELKVGSISLTIRAGPSAKIYCKKVELPVPVEKKIVQSSYRNGLLEVKLKKKANTRAK